MKISSEIYDENGNSLGRADIILPDTATTDDRIAFYKTLIEFEISKETGKDLDFGDFRWKRADE